MAERFRFFDSIDGTDERYYTADEFAEYFRQFIRNGIFNGGENLQVGTSGVNMQTFIKPGYAWLEGYLYKIDSENLYLEHSTADPMLDRIDRVVIRLDKTLENRFVKSFVLEGMSSADPEPMELTRSNNITEISLAQVRILAGKSYVEEASITDERLDNTVCGIVTHMFEQVNTTAIYNQFKTWLDAKTSEPDGDFYREWRDWITEMQDITNIVTMTQFNSHKTETAVLIPKAESTANSIALDIVLTDKKKGTLRASVNNTGNMTINGKAFKKDVENEIPANGVKAGKVYDFYYDSTADCVFILAKASGTAQPSDVLAGETFSNDDGELVGTKDLSNLTPPNVKKGVVIDGVTGSLESKLENKLYAEAFNISAVQSKPVAIINGEYYTAQILVSGKITIRVYNTSFTMVREYLIEPPHHVSRIIRYSSGSKYFGYNENSGKLNVVSWSGTAITQNITFGYTSDVLFASASGVYIYYLSASSELRINSYNGTAVGSISGVKTINMGFVVDGILYLIGLTTGNNIAVYKLQSTGSTTTLSTEGFNAFASPILSQ